MAVLAHNLRAAGGLSVGRNVIAALARVRPAHSYLLFLPRGIGYEEIAKPPTSESRYFQRGSGWSKQFRFERGQLPRAVQQFDADVVWGLGNFGLRRPACVQAVLVHKPHYIYGPEFHRMELWRYRVLNDIGRRRLKRCLGATQLVFCQTRTACERFRSTFGYAGRTAIMPNAVSQMTLGGDADGRPEVFDRLAGKFVLFCLTKYYAHKNLEALVDTFGRYGDDLSDVAVVFTVHEDDHPSARRFLATFARDGCRNHLINVGPVRQGELAGYFAHCDGLILPTLLESFSGTYLEAMQFRRPILTSDLDFAREVCGPAARYFDPLTPASIRDAVLELKNSASLRGELVEAGQVRMKTFFRDWDSIVADAMREMEALL
jgi:glycosyltransferase involved in cell wall biosynthesis